MRPPRDTRPARAPALTRWLVPCLVLVVQTLAARAQAPFTYNPVQEMRLALQAPVADATAGSRDLQARQRRLQERSASLCRAPELREALALPEWRDEDTDGALAAVDRPVRLELARRFAAALRDLLQRGDDVSRLAAANILADAGPALRGPVAAACPLPSFAPALASLVSVPDAAVRAAAARALGRIHADPAVAVPALGHVFESEDVALRRVAAESLLDLARTVAQDMSRANGHADDAARNQVVHAGQAVIPVACGGMADPDVQVRQCSIEALRETARGLAAVACEPRPAAAEPADNGVRLARHEPAELSPLVRDLRDQTSGLTNALNDPEPAVRLAAHHALEELAMAWQRLEAPPAEAPPAETTSIAPAGGPTPQPLLDRLRAALPSLVAGLKDPDVRARRAALDALETLGPEAASAVPALLEAVRDRDRFVRWAAVRTLGRAGQAEAKTVVPALVRLLNDPDLDVALAAVEALKRFGSDARPAVKTLGRAVSRGDAVFRLAAIAALEGIGMPAQPAIPALAGGLHDADPRVREAAARLLGRFGPVAQPAAGALRAACADPELDVRKAAGDALLEILPPPPTAPVAGSRPPPAAASVEPPAVAAAPTDESWRPSTGLPASREYAVVLAHNGLDPPSAGGLAVSSWTSAPAARGVGTSPPPAAPPSRAPAPVVPAAHWAPAPAAPSVIATSAPPGSLSSAVILAASTAPPIAPRTDTAPAVSLLRPVACSDTSGFAQDR